MRNKAFIILLISVLSVSGCVDPIEFDTGSEPQRLVVDGFISNVSYSERLDLPQEPTPFYVRLQWTGPVNNERNNLIKDASVTLLDDQGGVWGYVWSENYQQYNLFNPDFKAEPGRSYHIQVRLADGTTYESDPQEMRVAPSMGGLSQRYDRRLKEIDINGVTEFVNQEGVVLSAGLSDHGGEEPFYYRFTVTPSWVYVASLAQEGSPVKTCFVTNKFYFQKIITRLDRTGGYNYDLFFLETTGNERLFRDFTALVTQYSLSQESYEFWNELALQQESGGGIFDPPPFELTTNISNVNNSSEKVSGFFHVVHESSSRWYINGSEIPYEIQTGGDPCVPPPGVPNIPTPNCLNCTEYRGGFTAISTEKPEWWREYE